MERIKVRVTLAAAAQLALDDRQKWPDTDLSSPYNDGNPPHWRPEHSVWFSPKDLKMAIEEAESMMQAGWDTSNRGGLISTLRCFVKRAKAAMEAAT